MSIIHGLPEELYARAEDPDRPGNLAALLRNAALAINVGDIRLAKALVGLRTVRPAVEGFRDSRDFTLGTAMLADLDALIRHLEEATKE